MFPIYNGYDIQPVSSLKYLGVLIDQHLSGQAMVECILKKATGRLKFLYRHSSYFNQKLRKNLCSALLQCHLDYCCTSWFQGLSKHHQQKLQIFQNKMIRYIMHLGPRDHVGQDEFDSVKLLDTKNRSRQLRLNHMFNIFHSLGPSYFKIFLPKFQIFTLMQPDLVHSTFTYQGLVHIPNTPFFIRLP